MEKNSFGVGFSYWIFCETVDYNMVFDIRIFYFCFSNRWRRGHFQIHGKVGWRIFNVDISNPVNRACHSFLLLRFIRLYSSDIL